MPPPRSVWPTWLVVSVVLANLVLAGLTAATLQASHTQYQQDAHVTTQNLARLFERGIANGFDRIDISLRLLSDAAPPPGPASVRDPWRALLDAHLAAQPEVQSLQVLGEQGQVLAAAGPPTVPTSHQAVVDALRTAPTPELVVSKPQRGGVDSGAAGDWVVVLGRRLASAHGGFHGAVTAALPLSHFQRLLGSVDIGPHGAIAVRDLDNGLVARRPEPEQVHSSVGDQRISDQARAALQAHPDAGSFVAATTGSDSVVRAVSYRRVEGYPYYVIVGLAIDDFMAGWRAELRKSVLLVSLFAVVTITLATMLARLLRRREREMAALLRQAEQGRARFARLFNGAPSATVIMSAADKRAVDVNEAFCQRYGVTREQVVGKSPAGLGIGPTEEFRKPFWQQLIAQGHLRNFVAQVRLANGELRDSLINGELIDYEGELCALATSVDITDLREAERANEAQAMAEAANHAKTEFLSRMSHELRTPLNAVIGFSELLRDSTGSRLSVDERDQLLHIHQAGWFLLTLTNDVLDISRIEAGQFQVDLRPLPLLPLIEEALRLSRSLAERHHVSLGTAPGGAAALAVRADPVRLQQVLLNLISNAIKYNRPGGQVQVAAELEADDQVRIDVIDDGLGMTSEQLSQLYQPFNRLGRERSTVEGAGIGLSLTRQLLRLMHGRLELYSQAEHGTRASIWLPSAAQALPWAAPGAVAGEATAPTMGPLDAAEPIAPAPAQSPDAPQGTVLYVEDNPVNALLVRQLLARWPGVRCELADDGASGLLKARTLLPELLLLDMQLPDMGGEDVLRALRADTATIGLHIVALSANAMADDIARARRAGADGYWTKPIDPARFLADVSALLAPRPAL